MIKKTFEILYYLLIVVTVFMLLGLAIDANKSLICDSFTVEVDHSCGNFFVESDMIKKEVYEAFDSIVGQQMGKVNLDKIESFIKGMMYVRTANAYKTIDGKAAVEVTQRKPLARIINSKGHSYYIDTDGKLMPLSKYYTARVIVVTGQIDIGYTSLINLNETLKNEPGEQDYTVLKDIYKLTTYIVNHPLFGAFIDHVVVNAKGEFELVPKNGAHIVEFGSIDLMEQKFNKLLLFYNHGLTKVGWNKYSRLNLKYKNQVVCVN